jgi:hypothetical protein
MVSQFCIAWAASHQGYPYIFAGVQYFRLLADVAVQLLVGQLGQITVTLPRRATLHG